MNQILPKTSGLSTGSGENSDGREKEVYWPADLVHQTAPKSRILTYGYDTNVRHWAAGQVSQKTLYDHANDLLTSLEAMRRGATEQKRPILFIVHSLGGLVTKVALRKARDCLSTKPHIHQIYGSTSGLIFFGTPHRGADPRNFFHHMLSALGPILGVQVNNRIVNALMPEDERLAEWGAEFLTMCHERKWLVYSFQEEYGVAGLFGKKVVEDSSSCLDDPTVETKQHIASNHMDMCRFGDAESPEYLKVAAAITFILDKIASNPSAPATGQAAWSTLPSSNESVASGALDAEKETAACSTPATGVNSDLRQSLKEQLYFEKIDERLTNLAAAQGKTCRWFLSSPAYTSWIDPSQRESHSGFLWIKGNPGTGKSTLMKFLFEDAKEKSKGIPSQITLSFFFLARGTIEERSTTGLYRSLLHQLFAKAPDLEMALEWMTPDGARVIARDGWRDQSLKRTLQHTIRYIGHRSLTILIDALDECDKEQVADMVFFFEDLCTIATEAEILLQICFSSRHYPTVQINNGIELTLEIEDGQAADIQSYIRAKLRVGKSKAAQTLMSDIFDKSSRIFLWVVLVLDILNVEYPSHAGSVSKMKRRLNDIPEGLAELFEMILTRDGDNLKQLQACLKWILFATRPLEPKELFFAVRFATEKDDFDGHWNEDDDDSSEMKTFVRNASKGLAEITRGKKPNVQFIHESVRDFLLGRYQSQWSDSSKNFCRPSTRSTQVLLPGSDHGFIHPNAWELDRGFSSYITQC